MPEPSKKAKRLEALLLRRRERRPFAPASGEGPFQIALVQEGIWLHQQLEPASRENNLKLSLRLTGALDEEALVASIAEIVRRHEPLRTLFRTDGDRAIQVVGADATLAVPRHDARAWPAAQVEASLAALGNTRFDLEKGPLFLPTLFRTREDEWVLFVVVHHIVWDFGSTAMFLRELQAIYPAKARGDASPLDPLPLRYRDYSTHQRASFDGVQASQLAYWEEQLREAPQSPTLLPDGGTRPTAKGATLAFEVPPAAADKVRAFARSLDVSPFVVAFAAFDALLHRLTGATDVVVAVPVDDRALPGTRQLIGFFANTLVMRVAVASELSFAALVERVEDVVQDGILHSEVPYSQLAKMLRRAAQPGASVHPKMLFAFSNDLAEKSLALGDVRGELSYLTGEQEERFDTSDVSFRVRSRGAEGFAGYVAYRPDLFDRATIEQLVERYCRLLDRAITSPDLPIGKLDLLSDAERASVLAWSAAEKAWVLDAALEPAPIGVPGQLHRGDGTPDRVVVVRGERLFRTDDVARWRADGRLEVLPRPAKKRHVVVASTFTADPVREALGYWLSELGGELEVRFAPFGQVFQVLLDPSSDVAQNHGGVNLFFVRAEDWPRNECVGAARELVTTLAARAPAMASPCVLVVCPSRADHPEIAEAERALLEIGRGTPGLHVLGPTWVSRYAVRELFDPQAEKLGAIPYTEEAFAALGTTAARSVHALLAPPYKVVAVDADETLWGGVVGEDGVDGVVFDAPRRALQERLVALHDAGVLVCVVSKNEEADVLEVFEKRSAEMPLGKSHVTAFRVNWEPKPQNLASLARELDLGLDSFVFVDDSPVECAAVAAALPEVMVVRVPKDPSEIDAALDRVWAFDRLRGVTAEDKKRAEHYRANAAREQLRTQTTSLRDFLESLEIEIAIAPMTEGDVERVAQLTQRTNQFNCTTVRRTEQEVAVACAPRGTLDALTVRVRDRFGDYGLVGVVLFDRRDGRLWVDTLLLSCRALGRGVEHTILARLGEVAEKEGLAAIDLPFRKTARNEPAEVFLRAVAESSAERGAERVFSLSPAGARSALARAHAVVAAPAPQEGTSAASITHAARLQALGRAASFRDAAAIVDALKEVGTRERTSTTHAPYVAPRTPLEKTLTDVFAEALRVSRVGVDDDFFALGGDSVLIIKVVSLATKADIQLTANDVNEARTVTRLAARITAAMPAQALAELVRTKADQSSDVETELI